MAKKFRKEAARRAREGRAKARKSTTPESQPTDSEMERDCPVTPMAINASDSECGYTGGVNCIISEGDEYGESSAWSSDGDTDFESLSECEGDDLVANLQGLMEEVTAPVGPAQYDQIMGVKSSKEWAKIEKNRALGYNGNSIRTQQEKAKKAREQASFREEAQTSTDPQISMMRGFFAAQPQPTITSTSPSPLAHPTSSDLRLENPANYLSDMSDDEEDIDEGADDADDEHETSETAPARQSRVPPHKRQKLDIPYRTQRKEKSAEQLLNLGKALADIDKLIKAKKTQFISGPQGLQARRTLAIQSHLRLVIKSQRFSIDASERAAESHGFAQKWGGRQLRSWSRRWVKIRELPVSLQGHHAKVYSLLGDPIVAAELRAYVRTNKWAVNPEKLVQLSEDKLIPSAADKYVRHLIQEEMPRGLKKYMECELFPRIHLKVGQGISLSTARRWLHLEGFRYTSHKKGLYFDGHDRPDVVSYRQDHFLPAMRNFEPRLVQYVVGDGDKELDTKPQNYVERRLVLCAHDEMTAQANDARAKSWVLEDQHALRKKGVGRGIHKSDLICSTVGWLEDASQTLEYGKNYEGYWTGELFVKQLQEKIIPASSFERAHGAGYQALIMVDNSQGHSAYSEDALLASRMNVKPGGKQAHMHDGWFIQNNQKVVQPMVFPPDHPEYPNEPKGIKAVLTERGLFRAQLRGKCKSKCANSDSPDCCHKRILELQPDFRQQKSLVQEVIEAAGHLCIFLPKFHCELNFIEFFWGLVKKYLRDSCDYTFDTLKDNMPKALASVRLSTIRLWEHRMYRWMEAYRSGLGTADAQVQVRKFSSTRYKSHRRIPETVARAFD